MMFKQEIGIKHTDREGEMTQVHSTKILNTKKPDERINNDGDGGQDSQ